MEKQKRWFDRLVARLCEWLNDFFPREHALTTVGYELAGLRGMVMLPVDRRLGSNVMKMGNKWPQWRVGGGSRGRAGTTEEKDGWVVGRGTNSSDKSCGFWAYCSMSGTPCIHCGGKNKLSDIVRHGPDLCPKGKNLGLAWFGCCRNPQGQIRQIGFWDCCGTGYCSVNPTKICSNWEMAKNWCGSSGYAPSFGPLSYYCTVAIDQGECDLSQSWTSVFGGL